MKKEYDICKIFGMPSCIYQHLLFAAEKMSEENPEPLTHNTFVLPGDVITHIDQSSNVVIGNGVAQRWCFFILYFRACDLFLTNKQT